MLISKDTYCFHCKQKGFPEPKWVEIFEGLREAITKCPNCGASKAQTHAGNKFVNTEYFTPEGRLVPYFDSKGKLIE